MKKTIVISICAVLIICALLCTAYIKEKQPINEVQFGITGYTQYAGQQEGLFLSKGDRVAVISPSSTPSSKQVEATVEGLKEWGYVPVEGKYVCVEERTLENCLEDLEWALEDDSIKAIFCVRGGYGASEVMDIMPPDLIASSDKLIIGYSDITVYISAWTKAGVPSIHAAMSKVFTDLTEECYEAEEHILKGEIPTYKGKTTSGAREGVAEGILVGGNLSTFTSVIGTSYESTGTDQPYILFFEDVEEDLQHIHRYLTILKHAGVLDGAAGIIFGEWTGMPSDTGDYDGDSRGGDFESVEDMICRQILEEYDIPVIFDFPAGHEKINYPLLMGEKVRLSVSEDSYTLEWIY